MSKGPLKKEPHNNYTLRKNRRSCWITVGNISVYIRREADHVAVDLYPLNDEMADAFDSARAPDEDNHPLSP